MSTGSWLDAVRQAVAIDLDGVSDDVVQHAGRVVADTVGVSIAGHRTDEMRRLVSGDE